MALFEITPQALMLDESFQHWVNRSNSEDVTYWENWLVQHPQHEETVLQAAQLVQMLQGAQKPAISDQQVAKTLQAVTARIKNDARTRPEDRKSLPLSRVWRRVGAMALILLIGISGYWGYQAYLNPYVSYVTGSDENQTVQLPDGSKVVINAHSSLRFAKDWASSPIREVWLEGEGYFEIKHLEKPTRKFIVHASQLAVEVVGTTFNVWQRNQQTKVVLQTGKVELKSEVFAQTVQMKPGEMVEWKENAPQIRRRKVDTQLYTSWKENQLLFDSTPLSEVASLIETRYGYQVQLTDSVVAKEKFTYKPASDDFDVLLLVLQESFRVRIDKEKQVIQISSNE